MKFESEVFQKFHEFQTLVERLFDRKIIVGSNLGEVSMKDSISVSLKLEFLVFFPAGSPINRMVLQRENIGILLK